MAPCKRCGQVPEFVADEDVCYMCSGIGHDEIGNSCIGCVRGVMVTESLVCACDGDDSDDDFYDESAP